MSIVLNGTTGITTPTYGGAVTAEYIAPVTSFKNRIINGAMQIDQRNAGAAVTTSGAFPVDRWSTGNSSDGAFSAQQDSSAPAGFVNSVKFTITTADTSLTGTQQLVCIHRIEGTNVSDLAWGTANAQTVTLSFWVRSSLTGTFGGSLRNSASNRSYPFIYTISVADTWEQKAITIAGDTSGTWLTTTGVGINVFFGLGVGPSSSGTAGAWNSNNNVSATGAVSVIGTLSATWQVTGVQLEKGSNATSFDYRPYGQELSLCQRYYWQGDNKGVVGSTANTANSTIAAFVNVPVSLRATPSITWASGGNDWRGNSSIATTSTSITGITTTGQNTIISWSQAYSAGSLVANSVWHVVGSPTLFIQAEL
jgi:hypothetical protein